MGRAGAALQAQLVLGRFGSGTCHHPRCVFAVGAGFMGSSLPLLALQGCPAVALGAGGTTLLGSFKIPHESQMELDLQPISELRHTL